MYLNDAKQVKSSHPNFSFEPMQLTQIEMRLEE